MAVFIIAIEQGKSQLNFRNSDMAQGHKVGSSPAATKTKLDKPPVRQDDTAKQKLTKKQIGIICGIIAILVAAIAVALVFILNRNQPQVDTQNNTETTQTEPKIDYNQKITSADGGEFKADYQQGSEVDFSARFSDLKCEDNCKNVSEVKVGNKTLKQGEDYEIKSGSIIVILKATFLDSLQTGKFDLVIAVKDGDVISLYGVKFTIKPAPTCGEDEVLEKGECVKKPEEQPSQTQTSNNNTTKPNNNQSTTPSQPSQPSQPTTPSKSQAQIECENKAAPTGFSQVYWYSAADKQENGFSDDIAVGISVWNIDNSIVKMHWVNGTCRPAINQNMSNGSMTGVGMMPTTLESLRTQPYPAYQAAYQNQGRNMVVWYWGSQSNYTIEYMTNVGSIWSY